MTVFRWYFVSAVTAMFLLTQSAMANELANKGDELLQPTNLLQNVDYNYSNEDPQANRVDFDFLSLPSDASGQTGAAESSQGIPSIYVGANGEGPVAQGPAEAPPKPKKKGPPPWTKSHKGVFYSNDFSYLHAGPHPCLLGDCWKQMPVDRCGRYGTLDVGGQLRLRYNHEVGMAQDLSGAGTTRFENSVHDIFLTRLRLYSNWKVSKNVRVFVEGIFADVTDDDNTYAPRGIDRNYGDLLNAFVELRLTDSTTVRLGRQELLYGTERLVSPLDWANTRRTFEGVKLLMKQGDWAIDAFYTNFVPPNSGAFDEADYNRSFYGTWATYTGKKNQTLDLYYLGFDDKRVGGAAASRDFSLHTFGSRIHGSHCDWLYDAQGGVQIGRQSGLGQDQEAGFATLGLGRKVSRHRWKPTVWFYYDYASGDASGGDFNRFNQLYPLAHKYFGFIDAVQRSNVEAPNLLLTMKPTKKSMFLLWYWHFMSNNGTDIVPSIGGTPAQNVSKDLGDELDLIFKYTTSPRSNVLFGWSHFWRGNKINAPRDADFFYTQLTINF